MQLRLFLLATLFLAASCAQVGPQDTSQGLGGTSWQVVRFQGGDGKVVIPGDMTLYTMAFEKDGYVVMRIDCNRGRGTWKSDGKSQIEFGPMALTRALCPSGSMHDQVVKQLPNIRSYVGRNGRLFLSLMADGGTYELAPAK